MKKKLIKSLSLKKAIVSNFNIRNVKGGTIGTPRTHVDNPCSDTEIWN